MENLKYAILEDNYINYNGITLYRIQALQDFSNVKKGDIGGYIESYDNLSQHGNCWIYNDAKIYGNAQIYGNARIYGSAEVYEDAQIYENAVVNRNAQIHGNAEVHGSAGVCENTRVCGNARVYENAVIYEYARIYGNCWIYGNAKVYGKSGVCENAKVYGNAEVYGSVEVYGSARVSEQQYIQSGVVTTDLSKDIKENIRCQTGLGVFNNKVIAYKQVNKDLTSFYDDKFKYEVGKVIEVENTDMSKESCASGLHFSNMNYWNISADILNSTFLMAEIDIKDVITVQSGKIRCSKAKILGRYDIEYN